MTILAGFFCADSVDMKRETRLRPWAKKIKDTGSSLPLGELEQAEELRPTIEDMAEFVLLDADEIKFDRTDLTSRMYFKGYIVQRLWDAFTLGKESK